MAGTWRRLWARSWGSGLGIPIPVVRTAAPGPSGAAAAALSRARTGRRCSGASRSLRPGLAPWSGTAQSKLPHSLLEVPS